MKYIFTLLIAAAFIAAPMTETKAQAVTDYETAAGIRLGWGFTGTVKHFINDAHAVELMLNYRWGWAFYNQTRIVGLYQVHGGLDDIFEGLAWYWGGGGLVAFESYHSAFSDRSTRTYFGVAGVIGLDYAISDLPINVSVDFMPNVTFGSRIDGVGYRRGFRGDLGGVAIRYILK
nr:hypothetical protein [Saprospiraceae bacterium]